MLERLLTLPEVAEATRVSIQTLRRAVKSGELPCVRAGKRGQIRIAQEGVDAFLKGRQTPTPVATVEEPAAPTRAKKARLRERAGQHPGGASYRIVTADVREGLRALDAKSVNCVVTSPPYFWQRDYEVEGQIGHEATIEAYVTALVETFRETYRVLADDGVLFLNLGDAYYNAKGRPHGHDPKHSARLMARQKLRAVDGPGLGLPRKSLIGLPWRVALAMQADGWVLRSPIIWQRPNALGEPTAKDRPWRTYEHLFLFSKGPRYRFDRSGLNGAEDVWVIHARPENPYAHCAPFPVELVERCLACGCPTGGTVLDPFLGSGTTLVAAARAGLHGVGVELNDAYASLAERRIRESVSDVARRPRKAAVAAE
ncbi:DNA methyltransferase [Methylobacterium sp. yr596]|uniref:DNA methyltransferase n=1 Tax=Methylobacterium sp. yr596 TaxID=1761800 RepID=UPI0011140FB1|nr:DNA methyltransferase [Methylobacterium sp. yr596]